MNIAQTSISGMKGYMTSMNTLPQAQTKIQGTQHLPKATEYDHADIFWRMSKKAAISPQEKAAFLAAHPKALVCYMVENNPENANNTLRHEKGFEMLPYAPDKNAILSQIGLHISKGDLQPMNDVINSFKFNPKADNWTTEPSLVYALQSFNVIK